MKYKIATFFKTQGRRGKFRLVLGKMKPVTILLACMCMLSAKETGCSKSPNLSLPGKAKDVKSSNFLLKKLRNYDHSNIKFVNAQAKVFMEGNGQSIGVNANIIWIRDSLMWMNVKKFGLEAARVLVTKDSVFVLNRLEKTYAARGLESLQRQYILLQVFRKANAGIKPNHIFTDPGFLRDIDALL